MAPASHVRTHAVIIALLACNTIYYIVAGRVSQALDSVAWYALLMLFLLETLRGQPLTARAQTANHGLRLLATLAIAASAVLYVREQEWLDAFNLLVWVAVVVLLEIEIRRPIMVNAHRKAFTVIAGLLYAVLAILVVVWLARGKWMDAWDAALWLTAFGVLEMDMLHKNNDKNTV